MLQWASKYASVSSSVKGKSGNHITGLLQGLKGTALRAAPGPGSVPSFWVCPVLHPHFIYSPCPPHSSRAQWPRCTLCPPTGKLLGPLQGLAISPASEVFPDCLFSCCFLCLWVSSLLLLHIRGWIWLSTRLQAPCRPEPYPCLSAGRSTC